MFRSFRSTLMIIMVATATVPVIGISFFATHRISMIVEGNAERELGAIADRAATELRNEISGTVARAFALSRDSDVERAIHSVLFAEPVETLFDRFLSESELVSAVILLNPQGHASAWAPLQAKAPSIDTVLPLARPLLTNDKRLRPGEHRITLTGAQSSEEHLALLIPIAAVTGKASGVLAILMPIRLLQNVIEQHLPTGVSGSLFGQKVERTKDQTTVQASSQLEIPGISPNFKITVSEPRSSRFAVVRSTIIGLAAASAATVLILALIAYLIAKMVNRPLAVLEQHVSHYAAGRYDVPVPRARFLEFNAALTTLSALGQTILKQIRQSAEQERLRGAVERSRLETELRTLRTQMQPHFLFNILNNIGMMTSIDPERAANMITRLSDLYRLILDASKEPLVPLTTELKIVEHYLTLQEMRFGERLRYSIQAPSSAEPIFIPCMIIQTLVENAVKHGIAKAREGGRIDVIVQKASTANALYECKIINTGAAFIGDGRGTGIENTIKRLELLYGPGHNFHLGKETTNEGERTLARFCFSGEKI